MKKLFIYGLISAVLVSLLVIPAGAVSKDYEYDFSVPDPYYRLNDATTAETNIFTSISSKSVYFQDLSDTEVRLNSQYVDVLAFDGDWESHALYRTAAVSGDFTRRVSIATGFLPFSYDPSALLDMTCSFYLNVPSGSTVQARLRFTLADGSRTDFVVYPKGLGGLYSYSFSNDRDYLSDHLGAVTEISIPVDAVNVRLLLDVQYDNYVGNSFPIYEFASTFSMQWSATMIQFGDVHSDFDELGNRTDESSKEVVDSIIEGIVDIFNPEGVVGGTIWVPDVGDVNDSLNFSESTLFQNMTAWIRSFANLLDPENYQDFFSTYLSGFSFLATIFAFALEISFINDLIQISLLVGFVAFLIGIVPSVAILAREPDSYAPPSYEVYKARRDLSSAYSARYKRERGIPEFKAPSYAAYKARRDLYSSYKARYNRERGSRK